MVASLTAKTNPLKKLLTPNNLQAAIAWGGTAGVTALWLVQPFDWIKQQLSGEVKAE